MSAKSLRLGWIALLLSVALSLTSLAPAQTNKKLEYPQAKTVNQVDDYHGTRVADPYRGLEDVDSADTKAWVEAENKLTFSYLEQIPFRAAIKQRLTEIWNYERFGIPSKRGGRYFFSHNSGLQNQSVLFVIDALDGQPKEILDPNKFSTDGTVTGSLNDISEDGKLMIYNTQEAGSDWVNFHVRSLETGQDLPEVIKFVKFSGASFTKDGKGFFYSRYDEPKANQLTGVNYFQKLYFHKIGTPQSDDVLVYDRPDKKELGFGGSVTDDGKYLIIVVWQGTERNNRVYYKDLSDPNGPVVKLLDDFDASYDFLDNVGATFYFRTDLQAPRERIIAIDVTHPERANWKTVVPESKDAISGVSLVGDRFVISYMEDAKSVVKLFSLDGKFEHNIDLPGIGSANGFTGRRTDKETFYSFTSFTMPTTIYRVDFTTGKSSVFRQPKVDFDPKLYETKQIFYHSKDGTRVPMFITHKKGIKLNGQNPTYLYGYGGFNSPMLPGFSVSNLVWMEMGGVYATANLRGGGEYGKEWHEAGTKLKKQNVFDDFIAAAEWLIANKYTSTPKLSAGGRSNGGLLIGAVMTQRPDLFGAVLPMVGVMDMLRFHKFTIGWGWVSDYGSSDDAEQFKAIYKYSPLHNLKKGTKYPPSLVTTADHDDRVVPGHSFKFAATLQADQAGNSPVLIRIETRAGHGGGKPTSKQIEEVTDLWSFLAYQLGMKPTLPPSKTAAN